MGAESFAAIHAKVALLEPCNAKMACSTTLGSTGKQERQSANEHGMPLQKQKPMVHLLSRRVLCVAAPRTFTHTMRTIASHWISLGYAGGATTNITPGPQSAREENAACF